MATGQCGLNWPKIGVFLGGTPAANRNRSAFVGVPTLSSDPTSVIGYLMRYFTCSSPLLALALAFFATVSREATAQVPGLLNYQGKISVGAVPFQGQGSFKFALVNADGSESFWSNDGSSTAGGEPAKAVTLPVAGGLYSLQLGDTALPNMTGKVPASALANAEVFLRIWFNDGVNGYQKLSPDKRIASVAYAMIAGDLDANGRAAVQSAAQAGADKAVQDAVSTAAKVSAANVKLQKQVDDLAAAIQDPQKGYLKQIADLQAQLDALKATTK